MAFAQGPITNQTGPDHLVLITCRPSALPEVPMSLFPPLACRHRHMRKQQYFAQGTGRASQGDSTVSSPPQIWRNIDPPRKTSFLTCVRLAVSTNFVRKEVPAYICVCLPEENRVPDSLIGAAEWGLAIIDYKRELICNPWRCEWDKNRPLNTSVNHTTGVLT